MMDYHRYYTIVDEFKNLTDHGPVMRKLYSARETYGNFTENFYVHGDTLWPLNVSLNMVFWYRVALDLPSPEIIFNLTSAKCVTAPALIPTVAVTALRV